MTIATTITTVSDCPSTITPASAPNAGCRLINRPNVDADSRRSATISSE